MLQPQPQSSGLKGGDGAGPVLATGTGQAVHLPVPGVVTVRMLSWNRPFAKQNRTNRRPLPAKGEVWVSAHLTAGFTGPLFPFPSPSAHPGVWLFASSLWMFCFSSDLQFPVGLEECEAGVALCFVTLEQKGKQRLAATGLGFCGGLQADSKALGGIRASLW